MPHQLMSGRSRYPRRKLREHFRGHYRYLINYFEFLAQEVREYLADMGFTRLEDIIGRTDLIEIIPHDNAGK